MWTQQIHAIQLGYEPDERICARNGVMMSLEKNNAKK